MSLIDLQRYRTHDFSMRDRDGSVSAHNNVAVAAHAFLGANLFAFNTTAHSSRLDRDGSVSAHIDAAGDTHAFVGANLFAFNTTATPPSSTGTRVSSRTTMSLTLHTFL
jgi:hypothetical protein